MELVVYSSSLQGLLAVTIILSVLRFALFPHLRDELLGCVWPWVAPLGPRFGLHKAEAM